MIRYLPTTSPHVNILYVSYRHRVVMYCSYAGPYSLGITHTNKSIRILNKSKKITAIKRSNTEYQNITNESITQQYSEDIMDFWGIWK